MTTLTNTKADLPKIGETLYKNFTNGSGADFAQKVTVAKCDKLLTRGDQSRQVSGFAKGFGTVAPLVPAILASVGNQDEFISDCFVTSTNGQRFKLTSLSRVAQGTII
jgi:hypothetical protein